MSIAPPPIWLPFILNQGNIRVTWRGFIYSQQEVIQTLNRPATFQRRWANENTMKVGE
jgi:hypothetical protein